MKARKTYIHRGEILRKATGNSDLNIKQITKRAGYSRSSYYNHIGDPDLSYDILMAYGKAMQYDFTKDLPEMNKYLFEDPSESYTILTVEEAMRQRDHWRDKYYDLLEKYHKLVEEKLGADGQK